MPDEKFGVKLNGFTCVTLICSEAHVSYIECLSKRRRCAMPDVFESQSVDVFVVGKRTPLLVRINSSRDNKFVQQR